MASMKMHTYTINDPNDAVVLRARDILRPYLPTSLPLYRRLQFGRFFEATILVSNLHALDYRLALDVPTEDCWLIAFVDRTCRPETEVWMFANWEHDRLAPGTTPPRDHQNDIQDRLILQLIRTIKTLPLPTSLHQDLLDAERHKAELDTSKQTNHSAVSRSDYAAHLLAADTMLFGAIHQTTLPLLQRNNLLSPNFKASLIPNHTFLFTPNSFPPLPTNLPPGLQWGALTTSHFALVRARTPIPRQDKTLAILPHVAVYADGEGLVAWAFVGLDGSLSTLHVEPAWRGKGLAKMVSVKVLREGMGLFGEEGRERTWAHCYVTEGNGASVGVCGSLGAEWGWDVFWVRVDLGAVDD